MTDYVLHDRYEVKKQLGERHDQQTLLAFDHQSNQLVVVKFLLFNRSFKWEMLKLFEREANTLKEISHSAIPRYIDYFDIETDFGKGFAFVQSYIEAPSLAELVKAGRRFNEIELKQIVKAILEVLIYLHNCYPPIIHRDIKPSNILLDNSSDNHVGQIYLVDFGSVQATASHGGTRTLVGTYGYMPPEQFGERAVPASDLYGLGATLIYLASGEHPADLPQRNLRINFEKHVSLSPAFVDWLQWMIEPSLDQRLESSHHALQALESETIRKRNQQQQQPLSPVKPYGSKVVLTKSQNFLKILMPEDREIASIAGIIICLFLFFGIALIALFPVFTHWTIVLIPCTFFLNRWFGKICLEIDKEKISLRYRFCGVNYFTQDARKYHIVKLERTHIIFAHGSQRDIIAQKPQINVWAGTKKFEIRSSGLLSEPELDWLASELSDWLGIPIT